MQVVIRVAKPEEAEALGKLAAKTFTETFEWYNTAENMREYNESHFNPAHILAEIEDENSIVYIALIDNSIIGYAKLKSSEAPPELGTSFHIEIERLYVSKQFHDKKVGLALMNKCIEIARQKNLNVIWLGVWEHNPRAINFYTRIGFQKFGTHIFQLGDDAQTDYLMKLNLH
ncbi:MAG TPA: GNAT family N-acetyltransferase [Bacteroidia bacterium]|nr:GNAT family N-acetyltransferase [Bacteroidia bacterium]